MVGELPRTRFGLGLVLDYFQDVVEIEVDPSEESFTKETEYKENGGQ